MKLDNEEMKKILHNNAGNLSLLLGNGFTRGKTEFKVFSQIRILNSIKDKVKISQLIKKKKEENSNIEEYIRYLYSYPDFVKFFCDTQYLNRIGIGIESTVNLSVHCEELNQTFKELVNDFKENILQVFEDSHPKNFNETDNDINNCVNFLSYFHHIFTINYDLLLYWVIQKANKEDKNRHKRFKDGFAFRHTNMNLLALSYPYISANVHYLHGAIHLAQEAGATYKIRKNDEFEKLSDIVGIVKQNNELQSLMVIEGTSHEKLSVIERNFYLLGGFTTLNRLSDHGIVIHGCSIVDQSGKVNNDVHLWKAILNSGVKKIYIGIFEDNINMDNMKKVLEELVSIDKSKPEIFFYSSKIFSPWAFDGKKYEKKSSKIT